jgi:acylphosphatase
MAARLFTVTGRVQGVGFRNFVRKEALRLGVRGYAKNLASGDVEVLAIGDADGLAELAGRLAKGPLWASVRHVDSREASEPADCGGFEIR